MKKIKLLVSLSIVAVLSTAIVNEVVKIENENKVEIAESINKEKALLQYENKTDQNSENIEEDVVDSKPIYEESHSVERKTIENKEPENKVIVKNNDSLQNYPPQKDNLPNRGNNPSVEENTTYNEEVVSISEIEDYILIRVNTERVTNGLAPLINNNTMQKYARLKSKDMGDRAYFDHKNP
ncbi:MAG: CAP domain-containing protein, partial [Clostridium sp.]